MRSSSSGQASVDYVAALAVVALVFAAAASAVGVPWLAPRLVREIRHGICVVSGSACTPAEARADGLAACLVHARENAERLGGSAFFLRLDRDDVLRVERRSDGTVAIAFVDGWRGGVTGGVGVSLPSGAGAQADVSAGVSFAAGKVYELPDWSAAQAFLSAFARRETLTGEGLRALHLGRGGRRAMPPPAATYREGGTWAEAAAGLDVALPAGDDFGTEGAFAAGAVLGRRIAGPRTTYYVRLAGSGIGEAGTLLGALRASGAGEAVLEYTRERGRPVEARIRVAASFGAEAELLGASLDLGDLARWVRGAGGVRAAGDAGGVRGDATVALDLRDPANLRALQGVLRPGRSPLEWDDRLAAFGRRLDVAGAVDLDLSRTTRSGDDHQAGGGAGARFGGHYSRFEDTRDLLAAWSLRAGGPLRRREDCEGAA